MFPYNLNPGDGGLAWILLFFLVILGGYLIGGTHGRVRNYGIVVLLAACWPAGHLAYMTDLPKEISIFVGGLGNVLVWTVPIYLVTIVFARLAKSTIVTAWGMAFSFIPLIVYIAYFLTVHAWHWGEMLHDTVYGSLTAGRMIGVFVGAGFMFAQIGYARAHKVQRT